MFPFDSSIVKFTSWGRFVLSAFNTLNSVIEFLSQSVQEFFLQLQLAAIKRNNSKIDFNERVWLCVGIVVFIKLDENKYNQGRWSNFLFFAGNMTLPFFYTSTAYASQQEMVLDEDTSRHVIQVLRMKKGDRLNLTDGKGNVLTTIIEDDHKKHCLVKIERTRFKERNLRDLLPSVFHLLKNANRFEWFLEKATEIGVNEIHTINLRENRKRKIQA